jgi:hypothetical protein
MLQEYFENEAEMDEQADGEGPAESHMSESECMGNMQRCASLCVQHRYCLCILAKSRHQPKQLSNFSGSIFCFWRSCLTPV